MDDRIQVQPASEPPVNMQIKNYRAYRMVYFILGFVEVLLMLRFFLKILGANAKNFFAIIVYGLSSVLLLPFDGLFPRPIVAGPTAEPNTLMAMVVYALIAWGIAKLIMIMRSKPAKEA